MRALGLSGQKTAYIRDLDRHTRDGRVVFGKGGWTIALGSAFIIWVGFVLPAVALALALRGQRWSTSLGDAGWWLLVMLTQATTMHAIGLQKPIAQGATGSIVPSGR